MILKFLPYKSYGKLIFPYRASELFEFIDILLKDHLQVAEGGGYQIEEKVGKLNEILYKFKDHFSKELGSAPPPFSFILTNHPGPKSYQKPLRPGRVYCEPAVLGKVEEELKKIKQHHRIVDWGELKEIQLPATIDPKCYFYFKDIFLIPQSSRCFFCGSYNHNSANCPGLLEREPHRVFAKMLTLAPWDLAEGMAKVLFTDEGREEFLKYLHCRYFFNLPSFLPVVFYLHTEINSYAQISPQQAIPLRGGLLGLGLEDLMAGRIEEAKGKFRQLEEEDFRKELALAFVKLMEGNLERSLYYLESTLHMVGNPFLVGYLNYLKGAIYFHTGDRSLAEENFQLALKADSTCVPAFFSLGLLRYLEEEPIEKLAIYFHHPHTCYLAYLEPLFLRLEKELEEILDRIHLSFKEEALNRLKEAEDKYYSLKEVMPEEEAKEYQEKLKALSRNINQGGVSLIELGSKQALELLLEFNGYVFARIKKIKKELGPLVDMYQSLDQFWRKYPYKVEEWVFGGNLAKIASLIQYIDRRLKRGEPSKELRFLEAELKELKVLLEESKLRKKELEKKWEFRLRLYSFIKNFTLAEGLNLGGHLLFLYLPQASPFSFFPSFLSFALLSFLILTVIFLIVLFMKPQLS